jgi:hypothetical protein
MRAKLWNKNALRLKKLKKKFTRKKDKKLNRKNFLLALLTK